MRRILMPSDWPCKLSKCRPGAFVTMDDPNMLCFKSEYRTQEGKIEAYNVAGEFFAAGSDTVVWPVHIEEIDE